MIRIIPLLVLMALATTTAQARDTAAELFEANRQALFQVKVMDGPSGNRTALGSGFAIGPQLVATNYHVVARFPEDPSSIDILLVDHQGVEISADLVAFDVINDLALLRTEAELPLSLPLAQEAPTVGTRLYALGNPYDLGMSVTEGIYNGPKEEAFPLRIHYSGPVNSGMSGGPALDSSGAVVGVNVATARNSVGFLVPVEALGILRAGPRLADRDEATLREQIRVQVTASQQRLMDELLAEQWPLESFGGAMVPDKGAGFIDCWGGSREESDSGIDTISRGCNSGHKVRLLRGLSTLYVEYEFAHLSSTQLEPMRLYLQATTMMRGAYPPNNVREEDATNFHCVEDHVLSTAENHSPTRFKVLYCTRAYRQLAGLYDAFFVAMTTDRDEEILFTHFTLSGFTEQSIRRFLDRFLRSVQWQS